MCLRQLRLAAEITQREMAETLGIHKDTYAALEKEPNRFTIGQAKLVAERLGASVSEIFLPEEET